MATRRDLRINYQGVNQVLREPRLEAILRRKAQAIANAAGIRRAMDRLGHTGTAGGFAVDSQIGRRRARASVRTTTLRAMRGERKDRRLTRAIPRGRGG